VLAHLLETQASSDARIMELLGLIAGFSLDVKDCVE
jgi:hypothetical protein